MKTTMLRLFALMALATSMSCFAATDDSKHDAAPNASSAKQQEGCKHSAKHEKKQKQEKQNQNSDQQEKDFDRLLMGIYG